MSRRRRRPEPDDPGPPPPSRKAATVAEREVGAKASSLHALLADHGWRWRTDRTGSERWTHLAPGGVDANGVLYVGPRTYPLRRGDRIVVDEAGMVDLNAARALAILAAQTGAGIAMIGDPHQAAPVGHSGAMGLMRQASTAVAELTAVHPFADPAYAELTVRLRDPKTPEDALQIAAELTLDEARAAAKEELRRAREFALPPAHVDVRTGIG